MAAVAPNSIADLIRVAGELHADAATLRAAAVMLGLAERADVSPAPVVAPAAVPRPDAGAAGLRRPVSREGGDAAAGVRPAGNDPRPPRRPRLVLTEPAVATPPQPLRGSVTDLLPPPIPAAPLAAEPLFKPSHQRALLAALASVERPGREVDIDALVELMAARQPVGQVPRRLEATTRLGVQLLLDHGASMGPFRRDLRQLAVALRRVIGTDEVDALAIHDDLHTVTPLFFEEDPDDGPRAYRPASPRPVLLASDLGAGGPARTVRPAGWLAFAELVRGAGCPLVVLVPYPPADR